MPDFSEKVYRIVAKISKGRVSSYKEVAIKAGSPRAFRAVGNIMNRHNIKGLPCHRVVASGNKIGGYKWGIKRKIEILKSEGIKIINKKIIQQ
jgi:methylated-DNA-[protein]-cysteine S-methyltransferase